MELVGQGVLSVLFDREAAAMIWAFIGKGADDGVTVDLDAVPGYRQIGYYLFFGG